MSAFQRREGTADRAGRDAEFLREFGFRGNEEARGPGAADDPFAEDGLDLLIERTRVGAAQLIHRVILP